MGGMNFGRSAGSALVAAALFLAPLAPLQAAALDPRAAQLIAQSGKAQGIDALHAYRTMQIDATVAAIGLKGTAVQYAGLRDGRFAESVTLGPLLQLDGYDGTTAWSADGSKLVWTIGGDSARSWEIGQAYLATYALWQPNAGGAAVEWLGTKTDGGHAYDALRITPAGSLVPFELWFDQTSHLPARAIMQNDITQSVTTYADYRPAGGALVAWKSHLKASDGNDSDTTVTGVTFDAPGTLAMLGRPQTKPNDFSILGGKTSTTVPVSLAENHVYLNVMLDGKGPYRFIFDTGGQNLIDPAVAQEIGAFGTGSAQGSGVGSQTEGFSFAKVSALQVGDALLKDQLFAVAPTRQGFGMSAGSRVDGLIGWEVLARYVTTFDYAGKTVTLALPGTAQPPAGGHVVPFVLYGTQPQIACTIDAIPAECTIDTGARDTIGFVTPFIASHPSIVPAKLTAVGVDGFGFGGAALGRLGRVSDVGIDGLHLPDLVADYSVQTAGAFAAPFVAANIGGGLLRRFTVTFDYGNETMTLVPNADFAERDAYERAGLFLINRAGAIAVVDSRPGTPAAEAGVVKGDVITAVNGVSTATMTLGEIRAVFMQPAGTTVKLELAGKDGAKRSVAFVLRDFV